MPEPIKVVAIFAASPALSSILAAVLAATPSLRVRSFESQIALATYMRLSPVDLLVCDFDCTASPAGALARQLRADAGIVRRDFQIIALASTVDPDIKQASIANGIDEVIVKPMSPKYLLERVSSRLRRPVPQVRAAGYQGPDRRSRLPGPRQFSTSRTPPAHRGDNVVPLFKDQPLPLA